VIGVGWAGKDWVGCGANETPNPNSAEPGKKSGGEAGKREPKESQAKGGGVRPAVGGRRRTS